MREETVHFFICDGCDERTEYREQIKPCRFCGNEVCENSCGNPGWINGKISFTLLHCDNDECVQKALATRDN